MELLEVSWRRRIGTGDGRGREADRNEVIDTVESKECRIEGSGTMLSTVLRTPIAARYAKKGSLNRRTEFSCNVGEAARRKAGCACVLPQDSTRYTAHCVTNTDSRVQYCTRVRWSCVPSKELSLDGNIQNAPSRSILRTRAFDPPHQGTRDDQSS